MRVCDSPAGATNYATEDKSAIADYPVTIIISFRTSCNADNVKQKCYEPM